MAAFTAEDPGDRAALDAHMAKIRASSDVTMRAVTADGRLVGSIASFRSDGDLEITYWIDSSSWGRGQPARPPRRPGSPGGYRAEAARPVDLPVGVFQRDREGEAALDPRDEVFERAQAHGDVRRRAATRTVRDQQPVNPRVRRHAVEDQRQVRRPRAEAWSDQQDRHRPMMPDDHRSVSSRR
jgi:hypothetical protein